VTDANLVLGRIDPRRFLGGAMPLDPDAAAQAIERLAAPLGLDRVQAAAGVVRLADVKMALAVRSITTERGLDAREYALVAYGGGGPLHAVAIARELGIPRVWVPPSPSTFSAWGMLATDLRHDLVRTVLEPLVRTDAAWAERQFKEMADEMSTTLPSVGASTARRAVDMRYLGQEHTVTVEVEDMAAWDELRGQFDAAHRRAYGYAAPDVEVQLLNLRLTLVFPLERPPLSTIARESGESPLVETRAIYSSRVQDVLEHRVYQREALRAGHVIEGPAAIEEAGTTTLIEPGDVLTVEDHGGLRIDLGTGEAR
jgi:N-methylhydantoinase A